MTTAVAVVKFQTVQNSTSSLLIKVNFTFCLVLTCFLTTTTGCVDEYNRECDSKLRRPILLLSMETDLRGSKSSNPSKH